MIQTYMLFNFALFVAVTIPLVIADGKFVTHLKDYYPEAWEDLGKPGFIVDPKASQKIRSFSKRGGNHPMMRDPVIQRLAAVHNVLSPVQSLLFLTFVGLFVWLLVS